MSLCLALDLLDNGSGLLVVAHLAGKSGADGLVVHRHIAGLHNIVESDYDKIVVLAVLKHGAYLTGLGVHHPFYHITGIRHITYHIGVGCDGSGLQSISGCDSLAHGKGVGIADTAYKSLEIVVEFVDSGVGGIYLIVYL